LSFNIIVTHEQGIENYRFILSRIRQVGVNYVLVDRAPSIILLRVENPYSFVQTMREHAGSIQVLYRVIPVDVVVNPFVEEVAEKSAELAESRIPSSCTFRVTLHGRLYWAETRLPVRTMDAIRVIAERINRPVSLKKPDYVVYIRSIKLYHRRRYAAITVTTPDMILSKSGKP
jgi:tRNA acetyltransferase TAN1